MARKMIMDWCEPGEGLQFPGDKSMTRVLLTEDQADQRALYKDVLTEAGYDVVEAWTATEALELFQRCNPDIVVLDIQMPGVDGIEAMGKMVSKDRQIPVVLYSAFPAYKANFLTWAADAFVVKSGEPEELVKAVERVLKERGVVTPTKTATHNEGK
jgi:two-component system, response regulator, stage 0 sporulation protein F